MVGTRQAIRPGIAFGSRRHIDAKLKSLHAMVRNWLIGSNLEVRSRSRERPGPLSRGQQKGPINDHAGLLTFQNESFDRIALIP